MSSAMDKALMAMSLEEEDEPFNMPNRPEFSSCEKNVLSLIGRMLNPGCQKMASLIKDMPKKWQKYDKIRGKALSKERFQFIFKNEHDLQEIQDKGFQCYNEWGLAIERWVEHPPSDFLQLVPIRVRISNIPVNHYTEEAITALGDLVGLVREVAFDPEQSQSLGFVRVRVDFDVSKPLRRSKVVNLPSGEQTFVSYFYEKVQKRCLSCHRLTHAQEVCPLKLQADLRYGDGGKHGMGIKDVVPVLKISDPLFGVLSEEQVGINSVTGRPRIAPEVLEGMRQYLLVVNGDERVVREARVKSSVAEVQKDPIASKAILQLEPSPLISRDINKGKGLVFGYDYVDPSARYDQSLAGGQKLLGAAINAGNKISSVSFGAPCGFVNPSKEYSGLFSPSQACSTFFGYGSLGASPSGTNLKNQNPRKRPYKSRRKLKGVEEGLKKGGVILQESLVESVKEKRKSPGEEMMGSKCVKRNKPEVVPREGPPNA